MFMVKECVISQDSLHYYAIPVYFLTKCIIFITLMHLFSYRYINFCYL